MDAINHSAIGDENSFDQLLSDLLSGGGSLLQKHLSKELYTSLADIKTDTFESTLLDCIKCYSRNNIGLDAIGLFATDSDCYDKFEELFYPIIQEYHGVSSEVVQPDCEWGDATQLGFIDPNGSNIEWIQISCGRSIEQHLFPPRMNEFNFEEVLKKVGDEGGGNWVALWVCLVQKWLRDVNVYMCWSSDFVCWLEIRYLDIQDLCAKMYSSDLPILS